MREKASLNLGQRYWIIALEVRSYSHICVQIVSSDMLLYYDLRVFKSLCFFFFFLSLFFCLFSFLSPSSFLPSFVLYTMVSLPFPPPTCGSGVEVLFFHFSCLFLNLPFLAVRLRVHYSGITSTLIRPEG